MTRQAYTSALRDAEGACHGPLIPARSTRGRAAKWAGREMVNANVHVVRSGGAWGLLPHDFPAYQTVFYYLRQWQRAGLWEKVNTALREQVRVKMGRDAQPSAAISDSQSAKTSEKGGVVATTKAKMGKAVSVTFWSIHTGSFSRHRFMQPIFPKARVVSSCWHV
jgi:putative transposase